ncbi:biotin synthase BioB [Pelagibaculum spongiae]|uniref:Biotin synthase n=1 Tax=Pelagibaculum spongiae TaxID=2080658 RepID=A0A2V1GVJ1_9GAMM|nr:biotin synthase BioB [Pelagibaculum spongiae]PVZ63552.1 biotin synthase BioB [Pelagibaculum spongiae]
MTVTTQPNAELLNRLGEVRHDWTREQIQNLFEMPFMDLVFQAQSLHRQHFDQNQVQVSTLLSIKTGACPEDCAYCPQSARYNTGLEKERLLAVDKVLEEAKAAKAKGATRFCMGAAWRCPRDRDLPHVVDMVRQVKSIGLETCMTLGMLSEDHSKALADAGLDYYNHNLDTSREYYDEIITTRTYQDRLDTLANVRKAGMKVCAGGIVGMGEERKDRVGLLMELANLEQQPESVPVNQLVACAGTPLEGTEAIDPFEFVRCIAVARIMMPQSHVRLSAGRENMNDQMQAMCFMAGANSIFYGDKLLTTANPESNSDMRLFKRLGINREEHIIDDMKKPEPVNNHLFYDASALNAEQAASQ